MIRSKSKWIAMLLPTAAMTCSCSSEPAPRNLANETSAQAPATPAPDRPLAGNRLRVPAPANRPEDLRMFNVNEDPPSATSCEDVEIGTRESRTREPGETHNQIMVNPQGMIFWNGVPVTELLTLRQYLDAATLINPVPTTFIYTHPEADPAAVEGVRLIISQSLRCELEIY